MGRQIGNPDSMVYVKGLLDSDIVTAIEAGSTGTEVKYTVTVSTEDETRELGELSTEQLAAVIQLVRRFRSPDLDAVPVTINGETEVILGARGENKRAASKYTGNRSKAA